MGRSRCRSLVTDGRTSTGTSVFQREPTNIVLTGPAHLPILPAEVDPNALLTYTATLTDSHGLPMAFQTIYLDLNNPLYEATGAIYEAQTDVNVGRLPSSIRSSCAPRTGTSTPSTTATFVTRARRHTI